MNDTSAGIATSDTTPPRSGWLAVYALGFTMFSVITAELMPISLLTPMAADLSVTNGSAGKAVTITAVVAGLSGPLLLMMAGRCNRRWIVWVLSAIFVAGCLLSAIAMNLNTLLISRALVGLVIGGLWSLVPALSLRLVQPHQVPRAMAVIFGGVSAASVCAAPIGAFLGDLWGWRAAFQIAAGLGAVSGLLLLLTLPSLPANATLKLSSFAQALKRPGVAMGATVGLLVLAGQFSGYTFIRPFLEQAPQFDAGAITWTLLAFGIGGFFGNVAGGTVAARSPSVAVGGFALASAAVVLVLAMWGAFPAVALVGTALWGFTMGAFPVAITTWNLRSAPDLAESVGATMASIFQLSIALGSIIGGLLIDRTGPAGVLAYSGVAVLAGALVMLTLGRKVERTFV